MMNTVLDLLILLAVLLIVPVCVVVGYWLFKRHKKRSKRRRKRRPKIDLFDTQADAVRQTREADSSDAEAGPTPTA